MKTISLGKEKATELFENGWWEGKSHKEIAEFCSHLDELCCPFSVLHEAVEKTLGRPFWTHEFGSHNWREELWGEREKATMEDVLDLLLVDGDRR